MNSHKKKSVWKVRDRSVEQNISTADTYTSEMTSDSIRNKDRDMYQLKIGNKRERKKEYWR